MHFSSKNCETLKFHYILISFFHAGARIVLNWIQISPYHPPCMKNHGCLWILTCSVTFYDRISISFWSHAISVSWHKKNVANHTASESYVYFFIYINTWPAFERFVSWKSAIHCSGWCFLQSHIINNSLKNGKLYNVRYVVGSCRDFCGFASQKGWTF